MQSIHPLIQRHVVGVAKTTSVSTTLRIMRTARVSVTPVIDGGKLVGMLTRDIASEGSSEGKSVKEVMMKPKAFVEENASLDDVADMMIKTGMSRLPVVNNKRAMHFVGMITATEIVREMKK